VRWAVAGPKTRSGSSGSGAGAWYSGRVRSRYGSLAGTDCVRSGTRAVLKKWSPLKKVKV
jgi:hypothetical protein